MLDIYGIGIIISTIAVIIFTIKGDKDKMLISLIILLAIMLLKYIL